MMIEQSQCFFSHLFFRTKRRYLLSPIRFASRYWAHFWFVVLCGGLPQLFTSVAAQTFKGTRVILAGSTFTVEQLQELQPVADRIALLVDTLVPGKSEDYPAAGIICFEAPARWNTSEYQKQYAAPPVTISGPRIFDEPGESPDNMLRIALSERPCPNPLSLAFQLAHELAHVKMGHRTDNYLDETLAVALSLEVLRRLGYEGFLMENEGFYLKGLPMGPQEALATERWRDARRYWLNMSTTEGQKADSAQLGDRGFQMLGALLLLHDKHLHWATLLNASSANVCAATTSATSFAVCAPDLAQMARQQSFLHPLGLAAR